MSDSDELRYVLRMLDASIRSRALAAAAVLAMLALFAACATPIGVTRARHAGGGTAK